MASDAYRELTRDRPHVHVTPNDGGTAKMTVRCRMGRSRKFSLLDRLRFLFRGRMYVATVNGKAHTQVILAVRKPTEHAPAMRVWPGVDGMNDGEKNR